MDARPDHLKDQDSSRISTIAIYEVVDVAKCLSKRSATPDAKQAWDSEIRNAIGDAFTMLRLICEMEGWDWKKVEIAGEVKYLMRMAEYGKGIVQ